MSAKVNFGRLLLIAVVAAVLLLAVFVLKEYRYGYALPSPDSITLSPYRTITEYAAEIEEARGVFLRVAERYPGASVSVGVGRDVVWSEGAGSADLGAGEPVAPSTRFRIYSLSKPITAAAIAALSAQGELDLDASIRAYLPELPEQYGSVTARLLLGHLAGVRHYHAGEWMRVSESSCATPADELGMFIDDPLLFEPGERYSYSSYGYVLLSALVEEVSGMSFEDYLRSYVLRPAWMHNTLIEEPNVSPPAVCYEPSWFGRVKEARAVDNSCRWGAGAYSSTTDDLVRFCLALLAGRIVPGERLGDLFASMQTKDGEETGYSFGWGVGQDEVGRTYASHSGGAIGGRGALYLLREQRIAVAILANLEGERLTAEAAEIACIFARR
jgi:CubicO group peptidase (beta-lactamase class C family)